MVKIKVEATEKVYFIIIESKNQTKAVLKSKIKLA